MAHQEVRHYNARVETCNSQTVKYYVMNFYTTSVVLMEDTYPIIKITQRYVTNKINEIQFVFKHTYS
jgi:hypothetical protein